MSYRVRYTRRVEAAIDRQIAYLLAQQVGADLVSAWVTDLFDLADSLERWPRRHPVAAEESADLGTEIRRIVFGNYLLFYVVLDDERRVDVVHFRHAAQETNRLHADDLRQ